MKRWIVVLTVPSLALVLGFVWLLNGGSLTRWVAPAMKPAPSASPISAVGPVSGVPGPAPAPSSVAPPGDPSPRLFKSACDSPQYAAAALLLGSSQGSLESMGVLDTLRAVRQFATATEKAIAFLDSLTRHPDAQVRMAAWRYRLPMSDEMFESKTDGFDLATLLGRPRLALSYGEGDREAVASDLNKLTNEAPTDPALAGWFVQLCSSVEGRTKSRPRACEGAAARWTRQKPENGWAWFSLAAEELRRGDTQAADAALHRASLAQWSPQGIPDPRASVLAQLPPETPAVEYFALLSLTRSIEDTDPPRFGDARTVDARCAAADVNGKQLCQRVGRQALTGARSLTDRALGTVLLLKSNAPSEDVEQARAQTRRLLDAHKTSAPAAGSPADQCARVDRDTQLGAVLALRGELEALSAGLAPPTSSPSRP